jgi:hypothetical protein
MGERGDEKPDAAGGHADEPTGQEPGGADTAYDVGIDLARGHQSDTVHAEHETEGLRAQVVGGLQGERRPPT